MQCKNIRTNKGGIPYNCGKCHACRVNETSKWTVRCLFELDKWKYIGASFVTLTYDDEHLPKNLGLQKSDLVKFNKRLRINLVRKFGTHFENDKEVPNVPIVFRECGEYGDREKKYFGSNGVPLGRPHYHCIIYGLDDLNDQHREMIVKSWNKCDPYLFSKERGKNSAILPVCREDIAYVCGYCQKKLNGVLGQEVYGDRQMPFSLSSQKLGLDYAIEHKELIAQRGFVTLNGQKIGIPRYLRDKLGIEQTELIKFDAMKMQKENELIFQKFSEHLNKLGLFWMLDDWIHNVNAIERRFNSWVEKWQEEITSLIEEDYKKSRLLRGKGYF